MIDFSYYTFSNLKRFIDRTITKDRLQIALITIVTLMFPLAYFESFKWSLPGPKATHGFLKALFLLLIIIITFFHKKLPRRRWPLLTILMTFFILAYCLSAAFTIALDPSFQNLWYPFISFGMILAFSHIKLPKKYFYILIAISSLLVFCTFAFAFFSLMFRYSVDTIYNFLFLDHRANQLLDELHTYGKYVSLGPYIMVAPLCYVFFFEKNASWARKLLSLFTLVVTVLTAVLSNNRIDVLVVGIQVMALLLLLPFKWSVISAGLGIPTIIFGLYVTKLFFGFNLEERIIQPKTERDQETVQMRFTYWQSALYNFKKHPLFGTGPNTYNDVTEFPLREYFIRDNSYTVKPDYGIGIHNLFIERLADTGLVGFIAFVLLLFYFFRRDALVLLSDEKKQEKIFYFLFALSAWSWILYGVTDNGYGAQGFVTFFFLHGVLQHLSANRETRI